MERWSVLMALEVAVEIDLDIEVDAPPLIDVTAGEPGQVVVLVANPGIPGVPGATGPAGATVQLIAAEALGGHRLVTVNSDGELTYVSCLNGPDAYKPVWMTTAAWNSGDLVTVEADGLVAEPSWSWTPGGSIYLGDNGLPTQTIPGGALFVLVVGEVVNPTTISFRPGTPIILST
jgi:hypothetical protein